MKNISAFLLIVISLFSLNLSAQEVLKIDEILGCFPAGTYSQLEHYDSYNTSLCEIYPFYKKYVSKQEKNELYRGPMPDLFRFKEKSFSRGRYEVYKTMKRLHTGKGKPDFGVLYKELKAKHASTGSVNFLTEKTKDGKTMLVTQFSVSEMLWVFRYDNLPLLLKQALSQGIMEKCNTKILEKPVYLLQGQNRMRSRAKYYAFATDMNELLLAQSLESLQKMINAQCGLEENILQHEQYQEVRDYSEFLHHHWTITFFSPQRDTLLKRLNRSMENEKDLKKTIKQFEKMSSATIHSTQLSDVITSRTVLVFSDAAKARAHYEYRDGINWASEKPPAPVKKYYSLLNKKTKRKLQDRFIISTFSYDEELAQEERKKSLLEERYLSEKGKPEVGSLNIVNKKK